MTNGRKQDPDSYQFPCNYHDQGGPSSLLSLEDSKEMVQQKMETEMPQELREHRQGSDLTMPPGTHHRQLPKVLPQQLSPGSPRTHGDLPDFTSQGKKCRKDFSSFPEIPACGDPTSLCCWSSRHEQGLCLLPGEVWKAAAIGKAGGDSPCAGLDQQRLGHLGGRVSSLGHSPCHRSSWSEG